MNWFRLAFISESAVLPVMLSSKLLPEMETDDNAKREQLLQGVQSLPIPMQIERLKVCCVHFCCDLSSVFRLILILREYCCGFFFTGKDGYDCSSL